MASNYLYEATISSDGDMTIFSYGNRVIRFKTSPHLERYIGVKAWDSGYIICTAKYDNSTTTVEEYIDLVPVLENLYIEPSAFLKSIQKVKVDYSEGKQI